MYNTFDSPTFDMQIRITCCHSTLDHELVSWQRFYEIDFEFPIIIIVVFFKVMGLGFFSARVGYVHETVCLSQNSLEKLRDSHKPTVVPTTNVFKSLILVPQPSSPNSYASFLDIAKESL